MVPIPSSVPNNSVIGGCFDSGSNSRGTGGNSQSDAITEPCRLEEAVREILIKRSLGFICLIDWEDILPEVNSINFPNMTCKQVSEKYPAIFVVRSTMLAAKRGVAGSENSLWESVSADLCGPEAGRVDGFFYTQAVRKLNNDLSLNLVLLDDDVTRGTGHPHVMRANAQSFVPAYAVESLWTHIKKSIQNNWSVDDLVIALQRDLTLHPIHFLGLLGSSNHGCEELVRDILNTLRWACEEHIGTGTVLEQTIERGVPRHIVDSLCSLERISITKPKSRQESAILELERTESDNIEYIINTRDSRGRLFPADGDILARVFKEPKAFSRMTNGILNRLTSDDITKGLYIVITDATHRMESASYIPWSSDVLSLKHYSLYMTTPGTMPVVVDITNGKLHSFPVGNTLEGAYGPDGALPPEVRSGEDHMRRIVYTKNPELLSPIARLNLVNGDSVGIELRRPCNLFTEAQRISSTEGGTATPEFTISSNRIDGYRRYEAGVLYEGLEISTPRGCGRTVGTPVLGNNYQSGETAAMFAHFEGCVWPILAKKPGQKNLDIYKKTPSGKIISIKVHLPRATWQIDDGDGGHWREISTNSGILYSDQTKLSWMNTQTVGWPARITCSYRQNNIQKTSYLSGSDYILDPNCDLKDALSVLDLSKGTIVDLKIWIQYNIVHLAIEPCYELFSIQRYRKIN
jgi:hypothetical protein